MRKKRRVPSLLAPEAMGGDISEGGFRYQANLIAARVPSWLAQDSFSEMIRESLGDVEAKFFVPGYGYRYEFIEYKNHRMTPSEFWPEIETFRSMHQEAPGAYQRFVLCCTDVSDKLKGMIKALRRIRSAYPFYSSAAEVQNASINDFVACVKSLNRSSDMAKFIFEKVWFEIDLTDAENRPRELFRESLLKEFPGFGNLKLNAANEAYSHVSELIDARKNTPINRTELEKAIFEGTDLYRIPDRPIHIHSVHSESCDIGPRGCLRFEWQNVFGGEERNYPSVDEWNRTVVEQLATTRDWIISTNRQRRIHLSGHRRLSAAFAIGAVFSSVSGFVLEIKTKDGVWRTDDYPSKDTLDYGWDSCFKSGEQSGELAVSIGIKRKPSNEVTKYLCSKSDDVSCLHLYGESPLISAEHVNQAVDEAKRTILNVISENNIRRVYLFMAVPAVFAIFLGHRMNATCEIQCYE